MKKSHSVRSIILAGSLLLQLSTLCFHSRGAAGDVDLSFDPGSGVNGTVNAVAVQPDGKVIIGGYFTTVKGLARSKVARLNADGSGDSSFNPPAGIAYVQAVALQPDGKVLVGRGGGISRLNADGSLDSSFTANMDYEGWWPVSVHSMAVQSDGKVIIGGEFRRGENFSVVARLNANGSTDTNFNALNEWPSPNGLQQGIGYSVAVQSDGKVLVGGQWRTVGGTNSGLLRLNADGSRDTGFDPRTGVNGEYVWSVAAQSDGKVLIGGEFTSAVNGTNRNLVARLNADGSLDNSFNPVTETGFHPYGVRSVVVQPDGKVLIGGSFTMSGTNQHQIARLSANGSLDATFDPGTGMNAGVWSVALQPDGKVLIGGDFTSVNGTNRNYIARLNADGSLDGSFHPGVGVEREVVSLVVQPDGKVLIGGLFTFINGTNHYGNARLNADGSRDSTFVPNYFIYDLTYFSSDYVLVTAVAPQSDGKVLVGGTAVNYYDCGEDCSPPGFFRTFVARLNSNGSRDTNFTPYVGPGNLWEEVTVQAVAAQPDGKVLVGYAGLFAVETGIVRLNTNGTRDTTFNTSLGDAGPSVYSIVPQPNGKVLIGGSFNAVLGTNRNGIARLNANGSLDDTFNPPTGGYPLALQPDGKILVGGFARLHADGNLDNTFNPGTSAYGFVRSIALQPDGNILLGGSFLMVKGVMRPYVARLYGDLAALPSLNIARSNASVTISWPATSLPFQLQETTNLALPNSWSPVGQPAVTNAGQISVTVSTTVGRKFFRLKSQ